MPHPPDRPLNAERLRVLIVEDDELDADLIITQLKRAGFDFEACRVATEPEFIAQLARPPNLILADYSLPEFSGIRALRLLKERGCNIPFVMVSGVIGDERAAECIREGAVDYVLKDRMGRLAAAVGMALEAQRLRKGEATALSELRVAHATLQESERRYRILFESNPRPMWVYDMVSLRFLAVNDAAIAHYGFTRDEFLAMTVMDVRPPEDVPKLLALMRSPQTDLNPRSTWRHRKKDGTIIEVELASHVIPFDGHTGRLVLINDVTDRKALEAELVRAQRFESVGRLASGIAHDMNNILAPVMIAAPMLRMGLSPAERDKIISTIEFSARRGAELVRQLLIFGRGVDVRDGAVDVAKVIADLTRVITETFPKSITIAVHVADDLWRVRGEATQIHQVLLNLCVNARDAMPRGGALTIRADNIQLDATTARRGRTAEPGAYVRLCVTDTGAGISADIADKIFDPFFTTKPIGEGTGLGLATVVGIVKSQGGSLSFDSHVGQGTGFEVLLPAQFGTPARVEAAEPPVPPPGNRETILVVDDEPNIRSVLSGALSRHNYEVLAASDGAEAAAVFARHVSAIKLVIADIDMPFIDGVTLTKVLRNLNPAIKVILSTGTVNARSSAQAAEYNGIGFTSVLAKPYTAMRVLAVVHEALHGDGAKPSDTAG